MNATLIWHADPQIFGHIQQHAKLLPVLAHFVTLTTIVKYKTFAGD
jgi:hypothetical protein